MRRQELVQLSKGLFAAALAFLAVPLVLVYQVGLPWTPHANPLLSSLAFSTADTLAWVSWCACSFTLVLSVQRRVAERNATPILRPFSLDGAAAYIATAIIVFLALSPGAYRPTNVGALPTSTQTTSEEPALSNTPRSTAFSMSRLRQYRVTAFDTLPTIARLHYDDERAWADIAHINVGRTMYDGAVFLDPSKLRPGWDLLLPPLIQEAEIAGSAPPNQLTLASTTNNRGATSKGVNLPELTALGFGAVTAAALARRSRRRGRCSFTDQRDGNSALTDDAIDVSTFVAPFHDTFGLTWIEAANRLLTIATGGKDVNLPRIYRLQFSPDGVDVLFADPTYLASYFEGSDDHTHWRLPSRILESEVRRASRNAQPFAPILIPAGEDSDSLTFIPLYAGDILPVLGPMAEPWIQSVSLHLLLWDWAADITVTDDVEHLRSRLLAAATPGRPTNALFMGRPGELSEEERSRCSILTTEPLESNSLSFLVDSRAVTIHPIGMTLNTLLLNPRYREAVCELTGTVSSSQAVVGNDRAKESRPTATRHPSERTQADSPAPQNGIVRDDDLDWCADSGVKESVSKGRAEVRLLVAIPRIDDLVGELDSKRARRAVEVLAYLAIHHPDPVTGDRLRTRVLGTADADAASKTLFNIVGAARRALGKDLSGTAYLPPASRSGHYRISPEITVDVRRAERLAALGLNTDDPERALVLLRASLELVEGEPFSGLLSGYGWWQAEGHESRVAGILIDAVLALVRIALNLDMREVAYWAVEKGRLIDPFSDSVATVALQLAARSGIDHLRREWTNCCRRADELDPGALPSDQLERVYNRLRDALRSGELVGSGGLQALPPPGVGQANFVAIEDADRKTAPSAPAAT
jgi:hypothetical protein